MRLRTIAVAGAGAIATVAAAALIALSTMEGGRLVVGERPPAAEPARVEAPPLPLVPAAASPVAAAPSGGSSAAPRAVGWSAVPVSGRIPQLGREIAAPVLQGLEAARDRMDPCFEAEAERLRSDPPAPPFEPSLGSTILTLELESRAGSVVVVDAELDALGHSAPELVDCCQRVLRGQVMPAPDAPPGERYRLRYVLQ
jgi:hypothetical protein